MKRAIIIGATSGIGKEVAKGLLLQGCRQAKNRVRRIPYDCS